MELKTRSGLVPVENELPFNITTTDAEEFLQGKIDQMIAAINKNGGHQDDVKIMLFSSKCSRKFVPFMILLPTLVLKGKDKKKRDSSELTIFNPENTEKQAILKNEFYVLLQCFMYDKNDEKSFFSNTARSSLGITLKTSHTLKANRIPKVQKLNKGNTEYVTCLIDPIRLFHDMLTDVNDRDTKFDVEVGDVEAIKNGNFKYEVYRVLSKKKNRNDRSLAERLAMEVNQRVNG